MRDRHAHVASLQSEGGGGGALGGRPVSVAGGGTTCGCAVSADPSPTAASSASTPVVEGAIPGVTRPSKVGGAGRVARVEGSCSLRCPRLPQAQQAPAPRHGVCVGRVLDVEAEGVGQGAAGRGGAESSAEEDFGRVLFGR